MPPPQTPSVMRACVRICIRRPGRMLVVPLCASHPEGPPSLPDAQTRREWSEQQWTTGVHPHACSADSHETGSASASPRSHAVQMSEARESSVQIRVRCARAQRSIAEDANRSRVAALSIDSSERLANERRGDSSRIVSAAGGAARYQEAS